MSKIHSIQYSEIYLIEFPKNGHVQGGVRPGVVVQNDMGNRHSPTVHVVPLTTAFKAQHLPTHVVIPATAESGLAKDSVAQAEGTQPIDKERLIKKLGTAEAGCMQAIRNAICVQFNLGIGT
ncbi:MAG: type II toxin-antitoxin system PemK/MazF family toxin [bacterium]|nr:type II toxin-antitoxin system PemK/MazF family toxin [bacterium]